MIGAPLLREGTPIGVIRIGSSFRAAVYKQQMELLTTFADQAVIAIENARLLNELSANPWSSGRQPLTCSRSSVVRRLISRPCFRRW